MTMEAMNERERYIKNPLRLLRCATELATFALRSIDNNLYEFPDVLPYSPENYPMNWNVEAPVETEEQLLLF